MENEIHLTTDYTAFKFLKGNRGLNMLHVEALSRSIKAKDLTKYLPIIVSENMEIIDGQHRFVALKGLEKPIYYKIVSGLTIDDIRRLNSTTKDWSLYDYLYSYREQDMEDYEICFQFMKTYGVPVTTAIDLLNKDTEHRSYKTTQFRNGDFKANNVDTATKFAEFLMDTAPYYPNWKRRGYLKALWKTYRTQGFDASLMLEKMDKMQVRMVDCVSTRDYLYMLENIYNFRNSKPLRFF